MNSYSAVDAARTGPRCGPPALSAPTADGWRWRRRLARPQPRTDVPASGAHPRTAKLARLEAALFVAEGALPPRKLAQHATLADVGETLALIEQLNDLYDAAGSAFRVERIAGGFRLLTRPELASWLDRVHHRPAQVKLSAPLMETLAIIAYRQPCTRADVESVRGVQSAEIIKQLMERSLVRVIGEDDSLGRPYLYGTTRQFLESFGLTGLDDLPLAETLRSPTENGATSTTAVEA